MSNPVYLSPALNHRRWYAVPSHARRHNRAFVSALLTMLTVLLFAHVEQKPLASLGDSQKLPACEVNTALFPLDATVAENTTLADQWKKIYRDNVSAIIDEYLLHLQTGGSCGQNLESPPGDALRSVATKMKTEVHEEDVPAFLLQYLQAYQCALTSEWFVAEGQAMTNLSKQNPKAGIPFMDFGNAVSAERSTITDELQIAPAALHRTLVYLSGFSRLQPLSGALQCLAGASVDIKNALNLTADASACLPAKAWNTRTSLRALSTQ